MALIFTVISYTARAAIEDEYARKLLILCRKALGSSESGTLRTSLDTVRGETETIGKTHAAIASQMKSELEEPLAAFAGGMKERRKIVQNGIEKLLKIKMQQMQAVNKVFNLVSSILLTAVNSNLLFSREIAMNKTASESKAIWPKDIWSWDKRNAKIRQNWKKHRYN